MFRVKYKCTAMTSFFAALKAVAIGISLLTSLFAFSFISIRTYVEKAPYYIRIDFKSRKSLLNLVIYAIFSFFSYNI